MGGPSKTDKGPLLDANWVWLGLGLLLAATMLVRLGLVLC